MKKLYTLLLFLTFASTFAQNSKYQFARDVFKKEYKKQTYEHYKGTITVLGDSIIRYGEQVLDISKFSEMYKDIFIHQANLFADDHVVAFKTRQEVDAMTKQEWLSYNFGKNDTIKIIYLDELEKLNPNVKTKRFVFWRFYGNVMNPTECYFELQNNKATRRTPLDEFIKGARLTFFHCGTIIL